MVIPGTPRAPPTAPGPAPYTRPTPPGPTHSLRLPLRGPRPRSLTRPFLRPRPPPQAPPPPPPGSRGAGVAPGPPTCAEGNWGTASRSRPCSWEWMLARARWDRVSLCEKTEGGGGPSPLSSQARAPNQAPAAPSSPGSLARSPNLLKGVGDGLVAEEIVVQDV